MDDWPNMIVNDDLSENLSFTSLETDRFIFWGWHMDKNKWSHMGYGKKKKKKKN